VALVVGRFELVEAAGRFVVLYFEMALVVVPFELASTLGSFIGTNLTLSLVRLNAL
jgi:hypothetical protein